MSGVHIYYACYPARWLVCESLSGVHIYYICYPAPKMYLVYIYTIYATLLPGRV